MEEELKESIILTAEPRLVDDRGAALLCGISKRFWNTLDAGGKVPQARKIGRRSLWSLKEIDDWIAADCPERGQWALLRKNK